MPSLILHIGLPKTGSTFLQEAVFPHLQLTDFIDRPRTRSFADPSLPDGGGPGFFHSVLERSSQVWHEMGDTLWDELVGSQRPTRSLLVSDEAIGRRASRPSLLLGHLARFRDKALANGFDRFQIVALIRRQDHWIASHYAQISDRLPDASQAGFAREVADLTSGSKALYGFGTLLRYDVLLDRLWEEFGADDIWLHPFEHMRDQPVTFLDGLGTFIGEPLQRPGTNDGRNERAVGQDRWRLRPPRVRSPRTAAKRLLHGRGRAIALEPKMEQAFAEAFGEGNRMISARTGLDLASLSYPMPPGRDR